MGVDIVMKTTKSNKKQKTRQVVKTGDVIAIPLPDGRFAFGLKIGSDVAVYSTVSDSIKGAPIGHRKFLFATGVYTDVLSSMAWPKVGKDPVSDEEIEFASLGCIYDCIADKYDLYSDFFEGYTKPATKEQCFGLEPVAAWDKNSIVDRIVCSLKNQKTEWLNSDPWIPYALDLTDEQDMRRVPLVEVLL